LLRTNAYDSSLDVLGGLAPQQTNNVSNIGSYWGSLGQRDSGEFILYPNKINLNISIGVYSKWCNAILSQ
jgi:hypothetical protein